MLRRTTVVKAVVFTEQSPVLRQAATALGLKSNVWVEDWFVRTSKTYNVTDMDASGKQIAPTKISIWKYFELFNQSQLHSNQDIDFNPPVHTSLSTRKPYGKGISFEMDDLTAKNSYSSKLWVPTSKTMGSQPEFSPIDNAKPHKFFITGNVAVYPLELLGGADKDELLLTPISAASRRFYSRKSPQTESLKQVCVENGFESGLFFTDKQLQKANIAVRPDATPFVASTDGSGSYVAFNIEQLESHENILASLGRYGSPAEPVYLFSGIEVKSLKMIDAQSNFTEKYWVTQKDVQDNQWQLKEGATGVAMGSTTFDLSFFNVAQLENPAEGFARAGLLEMRPKVTKP